MKKATLGILVLATSLAASASSESLLSYLKSSKEPTIKDAMWMNPQSLYIGVIDNQGNRNGFASYVCGIAKDHGVTPSLVKVVDIAKVKATGKFVELGRANCK